MSTAFAGAFDKLHFTESVLGKAKFIGNELRVPVAGLFLLGGHPLESEGSGPWRGELHFEGVVASRRNMTEYIGDARKPDGFRPPHIVVDEIPAVIVPQLSSVQDFVFEGYLEPANAWIDGWTVSAGNFILENPSKD